MQAERTGKKYDVCFYLGEHTTRDMHDVCTSIYQYLPGVPLQCSARGEDETPVANIDHMNKSQQPKQGRYTADKLRTLHNLFYIVNSEPISANNNSHKNE